MEEQKKQNKQTQDCGDKRKPILKLPTSVTAFLKFLPLILFAALVLIFKLDLLIAAPLATFAAIIVYMLTTGVSFGDAFEHGMEATNKIILIFFILMFATTVGECFMKTGVGAAMINLALQLGVTARTIAPVCLLVCSLLSVATGSSWGTFAACAPIFLWLNHIVGGSVGLTVCAIAGGSCFGDNIGMISDVTVLSCGMQNIRIIDRVKHQLFWSIGCLLLSAVVFYIAGVKLPNFSGDVSEAISKIDAETMAALKDQKESAWQMLNQLQQNIPYYMIIPVIVVIVLSFLNIHTLLCLGAGILTSLLLGTLSGTISFSEWFSSDGIIFNGFQEAGSWVVIMMLWVSAFGGVMNAMDAFAPLKRLVVRLSGNIHHLMGWCSILCLLGNAALADEAAQVSTMSTIVRDIVEQNTVCDSEEDRYTLRVKLATFTSSMGIYGSQLIPWHCFPVFFAGVASIVYPLYSFTPMDIVKLNFTSFIMIGTILVLTFTGLDRLIPKFGLPKSAKLIKSTNSEKAARA